MKNRRRLVLGPLAAATVLLAFASAAYACTEIIGAIETKKADGTVCPNSASQGTLCEVSTGETITSTGTNLGRADDSTQWGLYFLRYASNSDSMGTCMGKLAAGEQKVGTESEAQGDDDSVEISGPIPGPRLLEPSGTGPARVCLISEDPLTDLPDYTWGTPSTELVLL